ncbi:ORF369 [White spot syndrome virus]|uniref:ORF369 n=1 Tax=White spot syndrome virus TaxID=342409 RepID=A0A2D3I724_9VIRU|nr:ORF369 [White spot syndrome virus]
MPSTTSAVQQENNPTEGTLIATLYTFYLQLRAVRHLGHKRGAQIKLSMFLIILSHLIWILP